MIESPYEILGVSASTDKSAVKRRYKELIRQYTPEHHPEEFIRYRTAYEDINTKLFVDRKDFPLYKAPYLAAVAAQISVGVDYAQNGVILSTIAETPFDCMHDLEKLLEDIAI